jgi:dTDP-4-dehydrorhamnose 3,5-epimerase
MRIEKLPIEGALLLVPRVFEDERGYFKETYAAPRYRDAGIAEEFVQDNVSLSGRHVLRGLHADRRMSKIVQVLSGSAFDVIADVRAASPTKGRWWGTTLKAGDHSQLYIPAGCLHGFLALEAGTLLSYKQSATYDPAAEIGVAWDDPDLAIAWPLEGATPGLSAKDAANRTLRDLSLL